MQRRHLADEGKMVQVLKSEWGHSAGLGNMGRAAKRRVGLFARDEEGSLVVFGMFCLIMMILVAGVGLDVFRFEEKRVTMQNTIDRAVLAAADLDQTLAPKEIVKDYFLKAGLHAPADNQITVVDSANGFGRSISVTTSEIVPTWFMRALGFNTLTARLTSAAAENQTRVEISLVLDVSGSMNSSNRLTNMKAAATEFVTQVLSGSSDGNVSVSVIPYATQVSAGADILNYLNVTSEHSNSNCLEFDPVDYENTQLEMKATVGAKTYQRNGNFDPFYTHDRSDPDWLPNCPTGTARDIQPFSTDAAALNAYINNLTAEGNTSIEIGIKWGVALLDPTLQPLGAGLSSEGKISTDVADHPLDYGQEDVMKVLVVMTDGQNTTEYRLASGYRAPTNMSFFYRKDTLEDAAQPYDTDNLVMYYNRSGSNDWYKFGSSSGW
ncbi:MAG: TadE/TadG family type IV pilus assembly protein, partial [Paracoccaceae bacterium]